MARQSGSKRAEPETHRQRERRKDSQQWRTWTLHLPSAESTQTLDGRERERAGVRGTGSVRVAVLDGGGLG